MTHKLTMHVLFNDHTEFYFVCGDCYSLFGDMQFSGSTHVPYADWRQRALRNLARHVENGGECEFCGPKGNGVRMIDGKFPRR